MQVDKNVVDKFKQEILDVFSNDKNFVEYVEFSGDEYYDNDVIESFEFYNKKSLSELLSHQTEEYRPRMYTFLKPHPKIYYMPYYMIKFLEEDDLWNVFYAFSDFIFIWSSDMASHVQVREELLVNLSKEQIKCLRDYFSFVKELDSEYQEEFIRALNNLEKLYDS